MKGYTFFLEYPSSKEKKQGRAKSGELGNHTGSIFARYDSDWWISENNEIMIGGAGAIYNQENSPCCSCSASQEYIDDRCKRVSEAIARKVHPNLFRYLEQAK